MKLYFINHTATYNPNNVCFGQSEMPLTENFTAHFSKIKDQLSIHHPSTLFISSPLRRCTKLANFLSEENYITDDNIIDINYGNWEMEILDDIEKEAFENWFSHKNTQASPNGESLKDVQKRALKSIQLYSKKKVENLVFISHALVIKSIIAYYLKLNLKQVDALEIDYGSCSCIEITPKPTQIKKVKFINLT